MTEKLVLDILRYIEDNLYSGIKVDMIANEFHFDRSYISRVFKNATNISIIEYINERKIIKTINDVLYSDKKMLSIALSHGFNSLEYYSETFYRVTSFSPSSLRNNNDIKKLLPFREDNNLLERLKYNHEIINKIRLITKPKIKTIGIYK